MHWADSLAVKDSMDALSATEASVRCERDSPQQKEIGDLLHVVARRVRSLT